MTQFSTSRSPQQEAVWQYFVHSDAGQAEMFGLFSTDFEFYFPKFGLGRGRADFEAFAGGLIKGLRGFGHDMSSLRFIESGPMVVVEGLTRGETTDGATWKGGETPGGRFSSVFEFDDGLIVRMYIYLDPDYVGADTARFHWGQEGRRW